MRCLLNVSACQHELNRLSKKYVRHCSVVQESICVENSFFLPSSYELNLGITTLILDSDINIAIWISLRKSISFLREKVGNFRLLGLKSLMIHMNINRL